MRLSVRAVHLFVVVAVVVVVVNRGNLTRVLRVNYACPEAKQYSRSEKSMTEATIRSSMAVSSSDNYSVVHIFHHLSIKKNIRSINKGHRKHQEPSKIWCMYTVYCILYFFNLAIKFPGLTRWIIVKSYFECGIRTDQRTDRWKNINIADILHNKKDARAHLK